MTYVPPEGSIPTLTVPSLSGMRRVHMIGVGGAGMSGIAHLMLARGIEVHGSDLKDSKMLAELGRAGAVVHAGHSTDHLDSPDAVVISTAIPERNAELSAARARGIPVYARIQALAALSEGKQTFGISGTHGKTTTTSMLAVILEHAGKDPTYAIGGDLNEVGSGARHGDGQAFVAEADESDGSFLLLSPDVAVVTNVEADHLDFYRGGMPEILEAFALFLTASGEAIACGDDPGTRDALALADRPATTYGLEEDNDVVLVPDGSASGTARGLVRIDGETHRLDLKVPGTHNLLNATAALVAAGHAGVDAAGAAEALRSFRGVRRRFEYKGTARGAKFYDDYAHHPTEISATLEAASAGGRLVAVFQPHRYSRTEALWRELGEALEASDVAVITDVYGAGEEPIPGVTGKLLVDALAEANPRKRLLYLPRRGDIVSFLTGEVASGDVVLTLGAGDITTVSEEALDHIREADG